MLHVKEHQVIVKLVLETEFYSTTQQQENMNVFAQQTQSKKEPKFAQNAQSNVKLAMSMEVVSLVLLTEYYQTVLVNLPIMKLKLMVLEFVKFVT